MNIVDKIKANTIKFSKKQNLIGQYLIQNQGNIPFMSLNELSKELAVSEVTILNFCKLIEVESFTDLKREFQNLIKEKLRIPGKMKSSLNELDSTRDAYDNAMQIQKMNFESMIQMNPLEKFEKASNMLASARKVYLCGMGLSEFISQYLTRRLRSIGIDAVYLNLEDFSLYGHDLVKSSVEDLFILIAFPDYSVETLRLHEYLVNESLRFISVTNTEASQIATGAETVLIAENKSLVFYNFVSNTITLLEILLTVLSYTLKEELLPSLQKIMKAQEFFVEEKQE